MAGEVKLRLPHELYPAYEIAVCCDGQKSSGAPWYGLWDPSMGHRVPQKKKDYIDGSSSSWQSQHHQGMMRGYWHGIWGRKMWNHDDQVLFANFRWVRKKKSRANWFFWLFFWLAVLGIEHTFGLFICSIWVPTVKKSCTIRLLQ